MRTFRLVIAAALVAACGGRQAGSIDAGVLGRVVVYRNGVAFYERTAHVVDGRVSVHVPRDRVDDFLKSLTVVHVQTREPLVVNIPRREAEDGSYLTMTLETPQVQDGPVLLTYVTEAPAWKPSYRIVVGTDNKVLLEGWAIVDNTTSEDWKGVLVGVGASSALAFRYDLWSVRTIDRDLLAGEERFAIAPPTAVSPYAEASAEELASLDADQVRDDAKAVAFSGTTSLENGYAPHTGVSGTVTDKQTGEKLPGVTVVVTNKGVQQTAITDEQGNYSVAVPAGNYMVSFYYSDTTVERPNVQVSKDKTTPISQKIDVSRSGGEVIAIRDSAPAVDATSTTQGMTISRQEIRQIPGRTYQTVLGSAAGSSGDDYAAPPPRAPVKDGDEKLEQIAQRVLKEKRDVLVQVHARTGFEQQAAARGAAVKNKLVNDGVPASRVHVVPKIGPNEHDRVRVLAIAPPQKTDAPPSAAARDLGPDTPVGESHFMSATPMTVRAGSSTMVSMVRKETSGGVVYLYDPISDRGDQRFAFKAVRLDNPTRETLEPGPVTVYGDGRFIGEGITEAVLPGASVVVPFALDKHVIVSRNTNEEDRIAKILTVQRGIMTAEVQHRRQARFTITNRGTSAARMYLRHKLETGWTLVDAPSTFMTVGDSQLFEVPLGAGETKYVSITEATPVQRSLELGAEATLGMMKVFIDEPDASPQLRTQVQALLATQRAGADLHDRIATLREQLAEYRARSGELTAQLVALRAVRTSGDLMATLRGKQAETSERIQKATIALVDAQEQLMLTRVKFQNQLADLRLEDATKRSLTKR